MKKDIENSADIELLINTFYDKAKIDPVIGFIFSGAININWGKHLPLMYKFWENVLFFSGGYEGNPIDIHHHLNKIIPLEPKHFFSWNTLFTATVDDLFEGENATLAKQRALSISTVLQIKILS